uniref:ATP synthase subunit a n=1 Tax=Diplonema papillatum TaxID=91374 RepID=A0A1L6C3Z2_9EUGL|nr:ATP synthase F0 subunit a [Diplonema papillatum]
MHLTTCAAVLLVGVSGLRVVVESTSVLGCSSASRRIAPLGATVAALLLFGVFHDTDLVACYLVVLLLTNHSTSSCVLLWMVHLRCVGPLGHLYLGLGMHSGLRTALGAIEALSCTFRSVSLGLRTACNAIAGHVLLAVLVDMTCCAGASASWVAWSIVAWVLPLVLLKMVTCVIQGTVYSRLLAVYWEEQLH